MPNITEVDANVHGADGSLYLENFHSNEAYSDSGDTPNDSNANLKDLHDLKNHAFMGRQSVKHFTNKVEDQSYMKSEVEVKHGIGWVVASMFILGDLVGGGVVAMPAGFGHTGMTLGLVFMISICFFFLTTGWLLADTWDIMRQRWPEYRLHCRKPYPEMGRRSIGKSAEIATKILVYFTLCGTAIVYLLLSSKVFHNLLGNLNISFSFCWLVIIVAIFILPITFLKSPADYWLVIVVAVLCTVISIVLIIIGVSLDLHDCYPEAHYTTGSFSAVLSLGIFLFAFNGHQVFPTVQNDMHNPSHFKRSVFLGFFLVALLYMPLSVYSFIVYGDSMKNSVIDSVQTAWIRYVADLAIAVHCILTIIITVNPINLQLEDTFGVPHKFGVKRVLIRTLLMAFILFIGLTIPNFSSVMDLFGSTTVPCTCIILPSLFNIYIHASDYDEKTQNWIPPTFLQALQKTSKKFLAYIFVINWNQCTGKVKTAENGNLASRISKEQNDESAADQNDQSNNYSHEKFFTALTIVCALICFYMSVKAITGVNFTPPCYVLPFEHVYKDPIPQDIMYCCGAYANISTRADFICGAAA